MRVEREPLYYPVGRGEVMYQYLIELDCHNGGRGYAEREKGIDMFMNDLADYVLEYRRLRSGGIDG